LQEKGIPQDRLIPPLLDASTYGPSHHWHANCSWTIVAKLLHEVAMVVELLIRFLVGGLVVSAFAVICDMLRPKSFAGIFGAAPSVALATLGLTLVTKGPTEASIDGRSMMAGAVALVVYGLVTSRMLLRSYDNVTLVAGISTGAWLLVAFGLWGAFLR
jgi:hypothetical protein